MLCPVVTGGVYLERRQLPPEWKWRKLPESAWDLHAVPELLSSVGLVIWVIAPHNDGDAERDGRENAALSVVAGYAEARPEIELRVLKAKNARAVVDVIADRTEFSSLQEYRECLKKIHDEWDTRHARELANTSCPPVRPRFETLPTR